nr:hypothetical protein [Brevibacillus laterosporus]
MVNKIKSDLQKIFAMHKVTVELETQADVKKNGIGEVISSKSSTISQAIIIRDNFKQLQSNLVGDISTGNLKFDAPYDTQLQEKNIVIHDNKRYHITELKPRWVFGEIVCYIGVAERADG